MGGAGFAGKLTRTRFLQPWFPCHELLACFVGEPYRWLRERRGVPRPQIRVSSRVSGQYGERFMFTTTEDKVMFLAPPGAAQTAALGLNVREPFTITKPQDADKGGPVTWNVARITLASGEQPDGTFAVPKVAETFASPPRVSPKPTARADQPTGQGALIDETNSLVDAYAEVWRAACRSMKAGSSPRRLGACWYPSISNGGSCRAWRKHP